MTLGHQGRPQKHVKEAFTISKMFGVVYNISSWCMNLSYDSTFVYFVFVF
ncbi:uncharacterized protein DS421_7g210490 [Arachis hypogaea]|nr:uncharacterized protein DS421_7g210490 [Arachis hypogaea]